MYAENLVIFSGTRWYLPTRVGIRGECNGQLQCSAPPILDVWCAISPQRKLARQWARHAVRACATHLVNAKMRVRVRWTENNKNPNIVHCNEKHCTRRLMRGMGARGMRCCVYARTARSRTHNYLERLHVKSPRTNPRAYVILLVPYCTMQLSSIHVQYENVNLRCQIPPRLPENYQPIWTCLVTSRILPDTLPIVPSGLDQ